MRAVSYIMNIIIHTTGLECLMQSMRTVSYIMNISIHTTRFKCLI